MLFGLPQGEQSQDEGVPGKPENKSAKSGMFFIVHSRCI
jgi:hypothetical protein